MGTSGCTEKCPQPIYIKKRKKEKLPVLLYEEEGKLDTLLYFKDNCPCIIRKNI